MTFSAAPHDIVLGLLLQIAVLLVCARALGALARRLGWPSVVGELLAGILLGPTLLAGVFSFVDTWIVPDPGPQGWLLEAVGMVGALFLMLITGMETDLALLRRHTRAAAGTSLGGILLPFASGFVLGLYLPASLMGAASERVVFALFVATAMSISAIPVIARVLMDMDLMRRDIGQTIIGAGMSNDAIGWVLLSIIAGLAAGGSVTLTDALLTTARVAGFLVVSITVGAWLVGRLLEWALDRSGGPYLLLSIIAGLTFAWAALAQALQLEAVFGAFVTGIVVGRMARLPAAVHEQITAVAFGIFTPVFFAIAGLKVNARALADPQLLMLTVLVVVVATFGKVVGGYIGGRWIGGRDPWTSLAYGIGMNARGAMEIIIATVGLNLGFISADMFSIVVVMAMATSLMAPAGLRWALARVPLDASEAERLQREAIARGSRTARIRRVLLPMRLRPPTEVAYRLEAALLDRLAAQESVDVTLYNAAAPGEKADALEYLARIAPLFRNAGTARRVVESVSADEAILDEAAKGYDLLLMGARGPGAADDALFHPFMDRVVRLAPCPAVIVQAGSGPLAWPPGRILVPVSGSHASREAAELAFRIASDQDIVVLLQVVATGGDDAARIGSASSEQRRMKTATEIVDGLADVARAQGVRTLPIVRAGVDVEHVVREVVEEMSTGMLVLGTAVRAGSGRLFLGPRVEWMLENIRCPVLVYNAAPGPGID